ncbi:hypothetical protein BH11BAC4_BH11BAC4_08830 [soil metagenome]
MLLNYCTFKKEDFTCSHCGWKGTGLELAYGDFSEEHFIADMNCPSCNEIIGSWQSPLKVEIEKWQMENPGEDTGWMEL